jgi:hypothetical protein
MFSHNSWRKFSPSITFSWIRTMVLLSMLLPPTLLITTNPLTAQVEWKDRYVTITPEEDINNAVAMPADDSCTVVVWQHWNANNASWDIMAQKVDNKYGLARWYNNPDVNGIIVCSADNDQVAPRAAYDGQGGVIVVWQDYREDSKNEISHIYAQRILYHEGMVDPSWPIDGNPVAPKGEEHEERPRIVGTIDGAYISGSVQNFV